MAKKIGWGLCLLVVLGLLGFWGWRTLLWKQAGGDLDADVATGKRLGIPFSADELRPKPPIADDDNAAPLILKIGADLDKPRAEDAFKLLGKIMSVASPDLKQAGTYEKVLQPDIVLARQASKKNGCDFHRDFDQGPMMTFPDLVMSKDAVKLLMYDARLQSLRGNLRQTLADLRAMQGLAEMVGSEPVLISMLVQVAERAICYRAIEMAMSTFAKNPGAIQALTSLCEEPVNPPDLRNAMRGEAYFQIATIRNYEALGGDRLLNLNSPKDDDDQPMPTADPAKLQRSGLPTGTKERAYMARMLEFWNRALTAAGPGTEATELCAALDRESAKVADSQDPTQALNKVFLPVFAQVGQAGVRSQASRLTTAALGRVMAFHLAKNRWPTSLAEAGVTTADPFGGAPLRMEVKGDIVWVYSVGVNLKDDKGQGPGTQERADDIAALYPSLSRPHLKV